MNAELYYLKNVALATLAMQPDDVKKSHPRFEELCEGSTTLSKLPTSMFCRLMPNSCCFYFDFLVQIVHGRPDVSDESRKATSDILKDRLLGTCVALFLDTLKDVFQYEVNFLMSLIL